jgi:acyl-CoA synthetase (AMP-forming)/AMP-acid ligase II
MYNTLTKEVVKSREELAPGTLYKALVRWAATQPDATAIVEVETGREITYKHMLSAVNAMRRFLGTTPRRFVVAIPGSIATSILWISALSGGHQIIPLAPDATNGEKSRAIQHHNPDLLFVEQEQAAQGFHCPQAIVLTHQMCDNLISGATFQPVLPPIEGEVYLTTSGTTGDPKGIVLNERQISWTADHVRKSHQLTQQDSGLTVLPFYHVNAPVVSLCASLLAGSTLVIAPRFSRRNFWHWIAQYKITWASIVPTIVTLLLDTQRPTFLPGSLRFMRTGSASLPAKDLLAFEERFGIPLIETYGLSEAASQVVANPVPPGKYKPGSTGLPVGVSLRICEPLTSQEKEPLRDVEPGDIGEICIAGPNVIHSYQDNVGSKAFQDGWFRTGDLGYMDEEGYLFIKGRLREVINRGGENITPREIEEVLLSHPSVREAAVVGRPDRIYGEQVVAYLVVQNTWNETLAQEIRQYAMQRLSAYKVPVDFIPLDVLPRTTNGKIERKLLRVREQANAAREEHNR